MRTLNSMYATAAFAAEVASTLGPGSITALSGPLGAGKTTVVRHIAAALGVDPEQVRSPSFTLVNVYEGPVPVYHIDLYRLERVCDIAALDLEEYLFGDGVALIEWPERIFRDLPSSTRLMRLRFDPQNPNGRRIWFWNRLPAPAWLEPVVSS